MEKRKRIGLAAALLFLLVLVAVAGAASAEGYSGCNVAPQVTLEKESIPLRAGAVEQVKMQVKGIQPEGCGVQKYGVDFTNGYDAGNFELAILGKQERNVFLLSPGETVEFVGIIGAKPDVPIGNFTIQATGYLEADHWKQASKKIAVQVGAPAGSDAQWKTQLQIGWNTIPYVSGMGAFGCDNITNAYRYSPSTQDYIELKRYGALFAPLQNATSEKFGGMFVFSTSRCVIESRPNQQAFESNVSLLGGQLLSVPPAWDGAESGELVSECKSQANGKVEVSRWGVGSQKWAALDGKEMLHNGEVLRVNAAVDCILPMQRAVGSG